MRSIPDKETACALLAGDVLRNVVTLKMLTSYASAMEMHLEQEGASWALMSLLPTAVSEWDRKAYPDTKYIAFIDGNSEILKLDWTKVLPRNPLVVKTGDSAIKTALQQTPGATRTTSYRSFTNQQAVRRKRTRDTTAHTEPDASAWELFKKNGYDHDELQRYFNKGARWFGSWVSGHLRGACFVYENYHPVWEIAGVYIDPAFRNRGLGKAVVTAALEHLWAQGLTPRYQAK